MKFKKLFLALIFVVGSLTSLTSSARWGGGWRGGWGWRGGVGLGVGVAIGTGLGAAYYTRPYGYYRDVDMCWADMRELRNAYSRALDRIKDLEAQLGK